MIFLYGISFCKELIVPKRIFELRKIKEIIT